MLTKEVMAVLKKTMLLLAALLLCAAANLRVQYDVEVAGETLALGCSAGAVKRAEDAARAAAEEILPRNAALPEAKRRLRLTLRKPAEEARPLTDALLRATEGVALRENVILGDRRIGAVTDAAAFRARLRGYIENTVPDWAWGGVLSKPLRIERCWGRTGYASTPGDMVLLVTGVAPVLYYDAEGNYSTV
ncbi:MAG: hypothetical protein K6F56_10675 [Oscillospiraceae bacterium]|nr:hypothetical protein [Oscillospiraceae bacterium]